jgi:hypothetical protein
MGDGRNAQSDPGEVLLRWLWEAVFCMVVFSLCSVLQDQRLLCASVPLTPPTVLRLSLLTPTYLLLRSKRLPIREGWRWVILFGLGLASLLQFALVPFLRECKESLSAAWGQPSDHDVDHRQAHPRLTALGRLFVVAH